MSDLQQLHDFYLTTKPSARKVQTASQVLIRLCKQLNVDGPSDINEGYYTEIPAAVDTYYENDIHKAIQDKSVIAEMVGRYGPRDGYEIIMEKLLEEADSNLRQFCIQAMEYAGRKDFTLVAGYIDRYKNSDEQVMREVVARMVSRIFNAGNEKFIHEKIIEWMEQKEIAFLLQIKQNFSNYIRQKEDFANDASYRHFYDWLNKLLLEHN